MIKTKSPLHVNHFIGGALGGLLAGGVAGILYFMLRGTSVLPNLEGFMGILLAVVLIGSLALGMMSGALLYREVRSIIWITLFAAIRTFCIYLVWIGTIVLKEMLGLKWPLGFIVESIVMPLGVIAGGWIGGLIISRLLLPKIRARAGENIQSLER